MNKQELIKKLRSDLYLTPDNQFKDGYNNGVKNSIILVKELKEIKKPVVPQFVADWYEENKDDFEFNIYCLCVDFHDRPVKLDNRIRRWFSNTSNKSIQTLVAMHFFGYEVEKEKLYTVKFANEDFGKMYIGIFKKFNKLGISSLPLNDDEVKSWFAEDELKSFKFWNNPAFEVVGNIYENPELLGESEMIKKYIKVAPVEAIQITPTNHEEVKRFIGAFDIGFGEFHQITTVSGSVWVHDYDYIIKNSDGECYPCAKEVFEKTYKEVTE